MRGEKSKANASSGASAAYDAKKYLHCVIYSKVRRRYKLALRSHSFAKASWWWFCSWHRTYLRDVQHSEAIAISESGEKKICC